VVAGGLVLGGCAAEEGLWGKAAGGGGGRIRVLVKEMGPLVPCLECGLQQRGGMTCAGARCLVVGGLWELGASCGFSGLEGRGVLIGQSDCRRVVVEGGVGEDVYSRLCTDPTSIRWKVAQQSCQEQRFHQ
jgi:hypothetical protein